MKITLDITDRELLDLDFALTERRINLGKQQSEIEQDQLEYLKKGDVPATKACQRQTAKISDEAKSLNSIIDKIYEAVDQAHQSESLN